MMAAYILKLDFTGKAVVEMFEKAYPKAEVTLKKDESGHDRMVRVRF